MGRCLLSVALLGLVLAGVAAPTTAHGEGLPWIWLEREQAQRGSSFNVILLDFAPYSEVQLTLVSQGREESVAYIACGGDGHGEGAVAVPADFPHGYAELYARDGQGGEAATLIFVGDVEGAASSPPPLPAPAAAPAAWQDPSVLTLVGVLAAAGGALVLALRRKPPRGKPATRPR
jgi:hypothetical protein